MSDEPIRPGTADHELVAAGAPTHAAEEFMQRDRTLLERLQGLLHRWETGSPLIVLVLAFIAFVIIVGPNFYDPSTLSTITQQVMVAGTLAIAQSLIILTAGIDLSVGFLMVLISVVMGRLAVNAGWPPLIALLAGVAVGAAAGFLNGTLVTRFKLPPFIATLGTFSIFQALNIFISKSETIGASTVDTEAPMLGWLGRTLFTVGGFAINAGVVVMLALFALMWFVLNWTAWGRHVYAVGSDPAAARLAGIRTDRVLLSVYVVAGIICAIAAWISIGRNAVSPQANSDYLELQSITAVVIGGISLFGGRGSILGALIGVLIFGIFRSGLPLAGLDVLWVNFAIGVLIIAAVALDQWIRRVKA
jgi:fructose transport system permease protein